MADFKKILLKEGYYPVSGGEAAYLAPMERYPLF
jgi:hypothetical protein